MSVSQAADQAADVRMRRNGARSSSSSACCYSSTNSWSEQLGAEGGQACVAGYDQCVNEGLPLRERSVLF
jgi:hypothetical protein